MARPITWQDVAGPNTSGALAAAQAAGDSITNALSGLGGVAQGQSDRIKADATKQAVAGILQSDDPFAAAAAAPQNWAVDPLAIAQAATQADTRLRANVAQDASVEASRASTDSNRAALQDRTDERIATTLSSPKIDEIIKTGKLPSIDLNSKDWGSAAGNRAYKQVLDFYSDYQRDKLQAEDMHLRRQTALKDKAKEDALGWARDFGASPEGQSLDPAEVDRRITAEFKKRGVSGAYVGNGAQFFEQGAQANRPTEDELDRPVPNDEKSTFFDINMGLATRAKDLQAQKTEAISKYDRAVRGQELVAGNVFKGPTAAIPGLLATKLGWSEEDAKEAIDAVKAEYKDLTDWQAADIALETKGKWFEGIAAHSDEAKAKAGSYRAFNEAGGAEGLAEKIKSVGSPFDRQLARLPVLQRQVSGAARTGGEAPNEAVNITKAYREAAANQKQADADAAQKQVDDAAAAQKAIEEARKSRQTGASVYGPGSYETGF